LYVLPYGQMSLWGLIKPQMYESNLILNLSLSITPIYFGITPKIIRLKGIYRIGPHNKDIISIIFGTLLGDAHAEKRSNGVGTRINLYQEAIHVKYLLHLHNLISKLGYCNTKIPVITTRLGSKGKIRKVIRFSTWTYTSFNWIHELWYDKNIKRLPECLSEYLTPLALAIWIMDDGAKVGNSLKLSTNSFKECVILVNILNENFDIKASIHSAGKKDQYLVYIFKESIDNLKNIVFPYIIPEMKYKLN